MSGRPKHVRCHIPVCFFNSSRSPRPFLRLRQVLDFSPKTRATPGSCSNLPRPRFSSRPSAGTRREREPNSVYAARRAKLAAQVDSPILLWGFTGREESSQAYIFAQEDNFYYLTGHNEEGAGLIILPPRRSRRKRRNHATPGMVPRKFFFSRRKIPPRKNGMAFACRRPIPGIEARTGFASVLAFPEMRATVEKLAKVYPTIYTILPYEKENGRLPTRKRGRRLDSHFRFRKPS